MIISFDRKFAFMAVPKTGSQAVRKFFRPHLGQHDWAQSVFDRPEFFPVPALAQIGHGHLKVREVQPYLLPGMWQDTFSFAFVRNPFDRFVSFCTFFSNGEMGKTDNPNRLMKTMITDAKLRDHVLMLPQHIFLEDEEGEIAVSFVGRFERLQSDFTKICDQIGFTSSSLDRINASSRRPLTSLFDQELVDMIVELYQRDFEVFSYDTNVPTGL